MKKLLFAVAAVAISLTSCKKDETDDLDVINENPTVFFTVEEGYVSSNATLENGQALTIGVEASSYESVKLKTLTLTRAFGDNEAETVIALTDVNELSATEVFTGSAASEAGTEVWVATVVDKNNNISTATLIITTNDGFNTEVSGAFFHIAGSLQGAYDLVNDVQVASSEDDASKDMLNTDVAAAPFTGGWQTGAGNGSLYVKANNIIDYDNVVYSDLAANFASGVATVIAPQQGDLYIAKLRGQEEYALIKITDVDENNNDCNCGNKGKMTFDYKK